MNITIRDIRAEEGAVLGQLLVEVYATLPGFPSPEQQPRYYEMLRNIYAFTERPATRVLVALDDREHIVGGVVYFGDMAQYGSGGTATRETRASGIRLLGVSPSVRGGGIGKALTEACLALARDSGNTQVILHTTEAMRIAWGLYERLGFVRSSDLDFMQEALPVFGFRLKLA